MNDAFASYLRSMRTLTQAQVDARTHEQDRGHMSASERLDMATHGTPLGGSEH